MQKNTCPHKSTKTTDKRTINTKPQPYKNAEYDQTEIKHHASNVAIPAATQNREACKSTNIDTWTYNHRRMDLQMATASGKSRNRPKCSITRFPKPHSALGNAARLGVFWERACRTSSHGKQSNMRTEKHKHAHAKSNQT